MPPENDGSQQQSNINPPEEALLSTSSEGFEVESVAEGEPVDLGKDGEGQPAGDTPAAQPQAGQEQPAKDTKEEESEEERRNPRVERRIKSLVRQREEAQERIRELEEQLAKDGNAAPEADSGEEPDPADFDDYEDYLAALDKHQAKTSASAPEKPAGTKRQESNNEEFQEALSDVHESFEVGRQKFSDFDEVIGNKNLKISSPMVMAMADTAAPEDIAYYLGKNPNEAARISALPAIAQAVEIGKLEERLTRTPPKKTTAAPPPINPVSGVGAGPETSDEDLDFQEYERQAMQRQANRSHWL